LKFGGRDAPSILGWSVEKVSVRWEKTLAEPDVDSFSKKISGMLVEDVQRRAKFIRIILCSAELVIHLRMSGDIRVESDALPLQPHDRLVVWFTNGFRLAFNDTRKFGRVWFLKEAANFFEGLGPEPLGGLTKNDFHTLLQRHHRQIKPLLMDQRVVAGLGNIYTDEALFLAGIHPLKKSSAISKKQAGKLLQEIQAVLRKGIETNGASIDWIYRGGQFQNELHVYNRTGLACHNCGAEIVKIKVGQRGTHFCPKCQPEG
jgi:formamidopyrimidine-DNA glycosylase